MLGWIASDGYISNNGFKILRKDTEEDIVKNIKDGICPELPLMRKKKYWWIWRNEWYRV